MSDSGAEEPSSSQGQREATDRIFQPKVERANALNPVSIHSVEVAGVRTNIIERREGVLARNRSVAAQTGLTSEIENCRVKLGSR